MLKRKAADAIGRSAGTARRVRCGTAGLTAVLAAGLASLLLAPSAGAVETIEGETCTTAVGEAMYLREGERQRARNQLSTDMEEPQRFVFTWANGQERVRLVELTSASCTVNELGDKRFRGEGPARVNGEPGYTVRFTIGQTPRGVDMVFVRVFLGREKIASFNDAALSGETIS